MPLDGERPQGTHPVADDSFYEHLLNFAPDAIVVVDQSGSIVLANQQTESIFGYPRAELIGRSVEVLVPERFRQAHGGHGGHRAAYAAHPSVRPMGAGRELFARRRDGTEFAAEISLSPVRTPRGTLVAAVIRDISERKRASQEIELLKRLALAVGEAAGLRQALLVAIETVCGSVGWDYGEAWLPDIADGRLRAAAQWTRPGLEIGAFARATDKLEKALGEGLGGRVWATARPEVITDVAAADEATFLRGEAAKAAGLHGALAVPIIAGQQVVAVVCFLSRTPIEEDRRLATLVCAALAPLGPLVRQKSIEDELQRHRLHLQDLVQERTAQLEATHEQLRLADRLASIGTLAAGLGHDMNNVLFPVRCRLDTLDRALGGGGESRAVREAVDAIRHSVSYLQRLTDGLHLLALDPEYSDDNDEATDLAEWWGQVEPILRKAVGKGTELAPSLAPDLPRIALAPHRLTQAVLNLVVNASDALGDREGPRIVRLHAEANTDGHFVRLSVADNGTGMTEEVRRRALDPFFTTKRRGLGTGLGLALVHGTMQAAGGTIDIQSAPGRGTTVTLSIPAARGPGAVEDLAEPSAAVTLPDPRAESLVASLLAASGIDCSVGESPEGASVWIVAPGPETPGLARRFLAGGAGRRVVLFGPACEDGYPDEGVIEIADTEDFDAIRRAVAAALAGVSGTPT